MALQLNVVMEIPGKDPREFIYEFDQDVVTLGRDSRNDIQIPLTTVSRRHARIFAEAGEHYIEDLRSTHGTEHNGKPLGQGGKRLLREGDIIKVMHFTITFHNVTNQPVAFASSEKTEQLARRMVQEVLSSMGDAVEESYLRVMNGPDEGKRFELTDAIAEVVIGRASECDLVINDANISRRHAVVRKDWGGITIDDLGSKNGVVINDNKIDGPGPLQDSDEIMLGAVRLTFVDPASRFLNTIDGINFDEGTRDIDHLTGEEEQPDSEDEPQEEEEIMAPPMAEPGDEIPQEQEPEPPAGPEEMGVVEDEPASQPDDVDDPKTGGSNTELILLVVVLSLVFILCAGLLAYLLLT